MPEMTITASQNGDELARYKTSSFKIVNGSMIFHDCASGRQVEIDVTGRDGIEIQCVDEVHFAATHMTG